MHELLPEPAEGESFYSMKAKGRGMKPNYWVGFCLASSSEEAEEIIEEGYNTNSISMGIQGLRYVKARGEVGSGDEDWNVERLVRSTTHGNSVVYRDGGEVKRVHRGMLEDD